MYMGVPENGATSRSCTHRKVGKVVINNGIKAP